MAERFLLSSKHVGSRLCVIGCLYGEYRDHVSGNPADYHLD